MLSINTIVVPQGAEYQAVCRGLQKAGVDCLNDLEIIAVPIGTKFVDRFLADYAEEFRSSTGILIVGLCGSLTDVHSVGDSVLVESCKNLNRSLLHLNSNLTATIQQKLSLKTVAGVTSDRIITQTQEKLALAQEYNAMIVEMEGYGYISKLQQRKMSVAMLRVVSDDADGNIPDLNSAIDDRGNLKTLPMAIAMLKQPLAAIRLIKGSLTGLKALEQIMAELFTE